MAKRVHGKPKPVPRPSPRAERVATSHAPERPPAASTVTATRAAPAPRAAGQANAATARTPLADYSYVTQDLIRIGGLAAVLLAAMIVLSIIIR